MPLLLYFLKAKKPHLGAMMGDLFDMPVQVRGYTRADGTNVPPHTEVRKVRHDPEAAVHAKAAEKHAADPSKGYGEHVDAARKEVEKPLRMDGTTRPERQQKQAQPAPDFASLHPKSQELFNTAWDGRLRGRMLALLDPANKGLRAEFERRSGIKLPKTIAGTDEAVSGWAAKEKDAERIGRENGVHPAVIARQQFIDRLREHDVSKGHRAQSVHDAIVAGNMGALARVFAAMPSVKAASDAALHAGFAVASAKTKADLLRDLQPQITEAMRQGFAGKWDAADEPAKPAPAIPEGVMRNMDIMLNPLVDGARGLAEARKVQAGGGGRYAAEYAQPREQEWDAAKARIAHALASIKDPEKRKAAQDYIDSKMPDLTLTPKEREWFSSDEGLRGAGAALFGEMAAHVAAKPPIDPTVTKTLDRIKRALADEATDPDSLRADLKKLDALDTKHWEDAPTREAILALRRQVVDGIEPARARKTERMRADLAAAKDNLRASQPKPGSFEAAVGAPMPHIFPAEGATAAEKPKPLSHAQAKLADLSKQYHKHIPLGDVLDAAKASGLDPVQEDGTPWSGFLTGADGRATIALVDRKTGKPSKRALSVQWHRMPSGNHELNAYIS